MSQDELIGWQDIAAFMHISVVTAWRYERQGDLPVKRLMGTRVRASKTEIRQWMSEKEGKTPQVK